MPHWTEHTQKITKKIAAMYKHLAKDYFVVGSKIVQDYECSKLMLQIDDAAWDEILKLAETKHGKDNPVCRKISMLLCYVSELRRLASMNLRELTGLTRDEVATLQRTVMSSKSQLKNNEPVILALTSLVSECGDADINDKALLEKTTYADNASADGE